MSVAGVSPARRNYSSNEFSIFRGLVTLTAFLLGTESTALYLDIVSQVIYKNYNYNKILQFYFKTSILFFFKR